MSNLRVFRVRLLRAGAVVRFCAEGAVTGATILIVHGIDPVRLHLARTGALLVSTLRVSVTVTHGCVR